MPNVYRTLTVLTLCCLTGTIWMMLYMMELNHKLDYLVNSIHDIKSKLDEYKIEKMDGNGMVSKRSVFEAKQPITNMKPEQKQIIVPEINSNLLNDNSSLFKMPQLDGENVIAMSLWGSDGRYVNGALVNAQLMKRFFPGWKMRIYTESKDSGSSPRYPLIPADVISQLRSFDVEIQYVDPHEVNIPPMMWRFLIADDLSVDHFIIRDCDGRLSSRDAAAVYQWILSKKPVNCIRDHPSHANYPLSGGLWGGVPNGIRNIFRRPFRELMFGYKNDYFQDMSFLIDVVWPRVKNHVYCSDSVSCDKWENSYPYPVVRYGSEHVGEVYDAHGMRRPGDIQIMRQTPLNRLCIKT